MFSKKQVIEYESEEGRRLIEELNSYNYAPTGSNIAKLFTLLNGALTTIYKKYPEGSNTQRENDFIQLMKTQKEILKFKMPHDSKTIIQYLVSYTIDKSENDTIDFKEDEDIRWFSENDKKWYQGKISRKNEDKTYEISYNNKVFAKKVEKKNIEYETCLYDDDSLDIDIKIKTIKIPLAKFMIPIAAFITKNKNALKQFKCLFKEDIKKVPDKRCNKTLSTVVDEDYCEANKPIPINTEATTNRIEEDKNITRIDEDNSRSNGGKKTKSRKQRKHRKSRKSRKSRK